MELDAIEDKAKETDKVLRTKIGVIESMNTLFDHLPSDWDVSTLGEINTKRAPTLIPTDFADETFEYYSIPDFRRDQRPSLTRGGNIRSSKLLLEPHTVLFGKLNPRVEKVWRVGSKTQWRQIGSTEWITVLPDKRVDHDYLYFVQLSPYVLPIAKTLVSGSTPSRQRVDPKSYYQIRVPLPPLSEQKKIAQVLAAVQRAIKVQERIIKTTTELKKTLMHKLFTHGLCNESQKQTEVGPVPESWNVVELQSTGEVVYGIQASVANNLRPVGTPILTNKNIALDGRLDMQKINYFELSTQRHRSAILRHGDILFNWRSGSKFHVGKTAYFDLEGEWVHSSFILRIRPYDGVNGRFLFYYLNHLREEEYFVKRQTYAVNAKFNKSAVNALPTIMPKKEEQDKIAQILRAAEKKIDSEEQRFHALKDLLHTLLHDLMTARIRVCASDIA